MHATMTSKGQVTVPKPLRDKLGLKPGDGIDFLLEDGDVRITSVKAPVTALKGMPATPPHASNN